jgi:phosphoribosylanthranilate isomerase
MVMVKMCGMTNQEDAHRAASLGVRALGFIFAPSSRQVSPEKAKTIIETLPPFVTTVGVFVNERLNAVRDIQAYCGLDLVQLHGDESPQLCASLMPNVIKAFQIKNASSLTVLEAYTGHVRAFLFDAYSQKERGGTGQTFDWNLALEGKKWGVPMILSGGLDPDNVKKAVRTTAPYAVDVGSGVEERPGKKDPDLMKRFMNALTFQEGACPAHP